jgi:sugar lactone lactonase YvrE
MRSTLSAALLLLLIPGVLSASTAPTTPTFVLAWGNYGGATGQLVAPTGVTTDALGNVYVCEFDGNRVQKFDRYGNFLLQWGSYGLGDGQFGGPYAITVDPAGSVYVAEYWGGRVQKFTSNGEFITKWGSGGSGNGQFSNPAGLTTDAAGSVYVSDSSNNRIQKFTSNGAYLTQWGGYGSGNGQLSNPLGITTDPAGNILVADFGNNRVQKFTNTGAFIAKWGSTGAGNGQLSNPTGVATDAVGNVYIVDPGNGRMQKFTAAGTYLTQWGSPGAGNGQFQAPNGACVDAAGNIYVAEYGGNRVQKFSGAGTSVAEGHASFLAAWGSFGNGNGQFEYPNGITLDAAGNVYVADTGNHRIQKFTSGGAFITKWGSPGFGAGQFNNPTGIAFDGAGNVYVVEQANNRIQKFTSAGGYLAQWGTLGAGNGQFNGPYGLAIDAAGNVYVADTGNHRIQKFTTAGSYVMQWGTYGIGNGQFSSPIGIAVDASGNVYVEDYFSIQKFTGNGAFIARWGAFAGPSGMTIGADGYVYAVNQYLDTIQKYANTGTYIAQWGGYGSGNGQFLYPTAVATDAAGNIYVADEDTHRIEKFAAPPSVAFVSDVRNDQGRQARLRILRSSADSPGSGATIQRYDVYRRIDPLATPASARAATRDAASPASAQLAGWEQVGSIAARGDAEYNVVVPTLVDATSASTEYSAYFVSAATADPLTYFDSGLENGISVDNLPPPAPSPFLAAYAGGATHLHWSVSPAGDFGTFRLYRGVTAAFVPSAGNLVSTSPDTGYADVGAAGSYYKLAAVDRNGNESAYALVGPGQTVDVAPGGPTPIEFALDGARPNPARGGRMLVSFALPGNAPATLELFDLAGRRIVGRDVGMLGAGRHAVDLASGHRLPAGMYVIRLTQGGNRRVVRAAVME